MEKRILRNLREIIEETWNSKARLALDTVTGRSHQVDDRQALPDAQQLSRYVHRKKTCSSTSQEKTKHQQKDLRQPEQRTEAFK